MYAYIAWCLRPRSEGWGPRQNVGKTLSSRCLHPHNACASYKQYGALDVDTASRGKRVRYIVNNPRLEASVPNSLRPRLRKQKRSAADKWNGIVTTVRLVRPLYCCCSAFLRNNVSWQHKQDKNKLKHKNEKRKTKRISLFGFRDTHRLFCCFLISTKRNQK